MASDRLPRRARLWLLLVAVFTNAAFAQSPPPPSAPPANAPPSANTPPPANMPRPACTKPDEFPGRLASDRQKRAWQNEAKAYGDCVKKFVSDQRAISDLAIRGANAAIEEYNALMKSALDESQ